MTDKEWERAARRERAMTGRKDWSEISGNFVASCDCGLCEPGVAGWWADGPLVGTPIAATITTSAAPCNCGKSVVGDSQHGAIYCFGVHYATVTIPNPKTYYALDAGAGVKNNFVQSGAPKGVTWAPDYKPPTCECGAEKIGVRAFGPGHSSWCPVKAAG